MRGLRTYYLAIYPPRKNIIILPLNPRLFGSIFSFSICFTSDGLLAQRLTPNLEDQVICDRGFLPLAFDNSMSSCKAAAASLAKEDLPVDAAR